MKNFGQRIFSLLNICLGSVGFLTLYGLISHKQVTSFEIFLVLIFGVFVWLFHLITDKPKNRNL
jgi:hypothetical protein